MIARPRQPGPRFIPRARHAWLAIHRWLGLGLGFLFVLIGLTGSIIVFDHAIDAWLNPTMFTPRGTGPTRPLADVIGAARRAASALDGRLTVSAPGTDYDVFVVALRDRPRPGQRPRSVEVAIDPATAEVLGRRESGTNLMARIYQLHYTLLLRDALGVPDTGMHAVGFVGLLLLVSTVSGLYLWWPRRCLLQQAIGVKHGASAKRLNFDLHRATGFWTAALLLVLAFSGVYMIFPDWIRPLVATTAAMAPFPEDIRSIPVPGARSLDPDRAVELAAAHVPGGTLTWVDIGAERTAPYLVGFRETGDLLRAYGDTIVWVDRWTGAVLDVRTRRSLPPGEAFLHWQFPLHSGEAFRLPGRLVVFAAGLAPAVLAVTGAGIWWRKRAAIARIMRRQFPEHDSPDVTRIVVGGKPMMESAQCTSRGARPLTARPVRRPPGDPTEDLDRTAGIKRP